jgi:hypothetical protein
MRRLKFRRLRLKLLRCKRLKRYSKLRRRSKSKKPSTMKRFSSSFLIKLKKLGIRKWVQRNPLKAS